MSNTLREHNNFLPFIFQAELRQFVILAKHFTKSQLEVICEIITNILEGNVFLSENQITELKKYRALLCKIRDAKNLLLTISKKPQTLYKIVHIEKDPIV